VGVDGMTRISVGLLIVAVIVTMSTEAWAKPNLDTNAKNACVAADAQAGAATVDASAAAGVARRRRSSHSAGARKQAAAILGSRNDAAVSVALGDVVSWCKSRGYKPDPYAVNAANGERLQAPVSSILTAVDGVLAAPSNYLDSASDFTALLAACNSGRQVLATSGSAIAAGTGRFAKGHDVIAAMAGLLQALNCLDGDVGQIQTRVQFARSAFVSALSGFPGLKVG
jgi:hypothetical protein